nr:hypothetical protein [Pirellula staleyi]
MPAASGHLLLVSARPARARACRRVPFKGISLAAAQPARAGASRRAPLRRNCPTADPPSAREFGPQTAPPPSRAHCQPALLSDSPPLQHPATASPKPRDGKM